MIFKRNLVRPYSVLYTTLCRHAVTKIYPILKIAAKMDKSFMLLPWCVVYTFPQFTFLWLKSHSSPPWSFCVSAFLTFSNAK